MADRATSSAKSRPRRPPEGSEELAALEPHPSGSESEEPSAAVDPKNAKLREAGHECAPPLPAASRLP